MDYTRVEIYEQGTGRLIDVLYEDTNGTRLTYEAYLEAVKEEKPWWQIW